MFSLLQSLQKICFQSYFRARKAKNIAEKNEKHLYILQIMDWERTIVRAKYFSGKTESDLDRFSKQESDILKRYENISKYQWLNSKIYFRFRHQSGPRSKEELAKYKDIMEHPLLMDENNALSVPAKFIFYNIKNIYAKYTEDNASSYEYSKKILSFLESQPEELNAKIQEYVNKLTAFIVSCASLKKYNEALQNIKKLRSLNFDKLKIYENVQVEIFLSYNIELMVYNSTGQFEKGIGLMKDIEGGLKRFQGKLNQFREIIAFYEIAYLYFGAKEYSKSLQWMNKILDEKTTLAPDIQSFTRILNLIIHYELKNNDLLEYIVKSTYRFLYKRNRLYKFETSILNFIRKKVPNIIAQEEQIKAFKELKAELEEITKDSFEKQALEYFDFISWLESKIEDRPFAEIVKEKARLNEKAGQAKQSTASQI